MKNNLSNDISWKELMRANRDTISLPFQLTLPHSDKPLYCDTLLRIIPKKRMVLAGRWGDKLVVAKLFYDKHAKNHVDREVAGSTVLSNANVPTPKLLYQGSLTKRMHLILFEKIVDCVSLQTLWQERETFPQIESLMRAFTIELATQHVMGIVQKDLHLDNFLITDKNIYTLDGATIHHTEYPLDKKTSLDNLALFFSQLGVGTQSLQKTLFQVYSNARGWLVKPVDVDHLTTLINHHMQERWRRFAKKIFRYSTGFKKYTRFFKTAVYDRQYESAELLQFLQQPDTIFDSPDRIILKNGRSSTVIQCQLGKHTVVIKRYNMKNSIHWLRRCLRESRAKSAWRLAQRLQLLGIPTAKPIAFIETQVAGLKGKSYIVTEYISGQTSGDFFSGYGRDDSEERYREVAKRIVTVFNQLSELRLTHGDLKQTNILISRDRPFLIDLDGMTEHQWTLNFQRASKKEWNRFMRNWEGKPKLVELFEGVFKEVC